MASTYAVIMAGGSGTRFWPASRARKPKQLLPLAGDPCESLVAATVRRLGPSFSRDHIFIATSEPLYEATANTLTNIPQIRFLIEPVTRNTAACIGWATATCLREDPEALVAVLPSDHSIADEPEFHRVIAVAFRAAAEGYLTTVGIIPSRPETGYGYIETGKSIAPGVLTGRRFVEKPTRSVAEQYLAGGKHLWNAGMFFFRAATMMEAIELHLPELADGLRRLNNAAAAGREEDELKAVFPTLPSISIDHGIMERASNIAVVPGNFGWNDIGSWESTWENALRNEQGNVLPPGAIAVDATNNLVSDRTEGRRGKLVALVGVHDLVVVDTDDALLIIPRDRSQEVRSVVDLLMSRGDKQYL